MNSSQRPKAVTIWISALIVLPLLAACGGGGGNGASGSGGKKASDPQKSYEMWSCTVRRKTEGLTGIEYWGSCLDYSWSRYSNQPLFTSLETCETAIRALQDTVASVYDNSADDKSRGWAYKLFCLAPDTTAPTVTSVTPSDGSGGAPVSEIILRIEFSEFMDASTFDATSITLEDTSGVLVPGTAGYSIYSQTGWFRSDETLPYETTYTARLSTAIADDSGNPLRSEYSWSFTTRGEVFSGQDITSPALVSVQPAADSICGPHNGAISARFDEPIVPTSFAALILRDSNGLRLPGSSNVIHNKAVFSSSSPLDYGEVYTAEFVGEITDMSGNAIAPVSWSFRTGIAPEGVWVPIATPANIDRRTGHTAAWTGSEMIIWGGSNLDGPLPNFQLMTEHGRYDPVLDQWSSISAIDAPRARYQHTATWTGTEMIIWGGVLDQCAVTGCLSSTQTGGRYDPVTDTWKPISTVGAPSPRRFHSAIWTGKELVIWGGVSSDYRTPLDDGARYDPTTDSWTPISAINAPTARGSHHAVFDGQRMIIWGGNVDSGASTRDGSVYDPVADTWAPLATQNAPGLAQSSMTASVASTGTDMFVWQPGQQWDYDPVADEWLDSYVSQTRRYDFQVEQWTTVVDACDPLATPNATWLKGRMLSWNSDYSRGQSYDEQLDAWIPIAPYPEPSAPGATILDIGDAVIVWGGAESNSGYRLTF